MKQIPPQIIRVLFRLSDVVAWLVLFLAVLFAVGVLATGVVPTKSGSEYYGALAHFPLSALFLFVAYGAFLITRRKVLGVFLLSTATFMIATHSFPVAFAYLILVLLVFAAPFMLALVNSHSRVPGNKPN